MERYIIVYEVFDGRVGQVIAQGTYRTTPMAAAVAVRVIGQLNRDVAGGWSHVPLAGPHQSILYDLKPVQLSPEQAREVLEQCYRHSGLSRRSERQ